MLRNKPTIVKSSLWGSRAGNTFHRVYYAARLL